MSGITAPADTPRGEARDGVRVAHRQHWGWWILVAFVVLCTAALVKMLLTNDNLQWHVVGEYLFTRRILQGLLTTLALTVLAMVLGTLLGVLTAVMRLSPIRVLSSVAWAYTWFFRGTPLLVQIIFWYNLAALFPTIDIGIPLTGPVLFSADANTVITPFVAAMLGLALNEGAYMSEIVRGGILSVDQGQSEAGAALGMRGGRIMRRIVLPQAMRVIVPPTGNQAIGMLKSTALVSVTSTAELLYTTQQVYNQTFQTIPLLIVASLWYLVVTSVLSVIQYYIERRYARGGRRELPPTPWQRFQRGVANVRGRM
ncbi:amino acid ABC transporter permease [Actinomadura logoneensis]|uniref:Amino acid ABC transporter permease n=1 Tax=Actinomadura logoneensis TaxID=2293572 RepID=A0A372JII3_9ACTN|nr:amino acid ABC transporter permease [Actinomadura logoneensis]RFU39813.1 amino acid ABC transporter permease [Actinomadura logoneensis]